MKNFLPYKQSIELKQLGFDEPCLAIYTNRYTNGEIYPKAIGQHEGSNVSGDKNSDFNSQSFWYVTTPLYQEVLEWFRDEKNLFAEIFIDDDKTYGYLISYFVEQGRADKPIKRQFKTYNEAQLACIDVMIDSIKTTTLTVKTI